MTAGKLTVGRDGRLRGPASIAYNDPWPVASHGTGSGTMNGLVQHTMVGNLPSAVEAFNQPSFQASAFFGVDQSGHIHQFIGVGLGLYSWAQEAGNRTWYSCEFADNGNPDNPMTDAQLTAGAQILECLSAFAGFPLQEANSPSERGLGVHYMGGQAWGGHTCPDLPPQHVRSSQRPEIIACAKAIRSGTPPSPPIPPGVSVPTMPGTVVSVQMLGTDSIAKDDVQVFSVNGGKLFVARYYAATRQWGTPTEVG